MCIMSDRHEQQREHPKIHEYETILCTARVESICTICIEVLPENALQKYVTKEALNFTRLHMLDIIYNTPKHPETKHAKIYVPGTAFCTERISTYFFIYTYVFQNTLPGNSSMHRHNSFCQRCLNTTLGRTFQKTRP
jgi:hypothetical protein